MEVVGIESEACWGAAMNVTAIKNLTGRAIPCQSGDGMIVQDNHFLSFDSPSGLIGWHNARCLQMWQTRLLPGGIFENPRRNAACWDRHLTCSIPGPAPNVELEGNGFRLYCSLCGRPWNADREELFRKEYTASLIITLALSPPRTNLGKLAAMVLRTSETPGCFATVDSDPDSRDVVTVKLQITEIGP